MLVVNTTIVLDMMVRIEEETGRRYSSFPICLVIVSSKGRHLSSLGSLVLLQELPMVLCVEDQVYLVSQHSLWLYILFWTNGVLIRFHFCHQLLSEITQISLLLKTVAPSSEDCCHFDNQLHFSMFKFTSRYKFFQLCLHNSRSLK